MFEMIVTLLVLAFVIVSIITRCVSTMAVGLIIPLVLSVTGVIPASKAFTGLGSTTIFLIVGALAIGDACSRTGLTDLIGSRVIRYTQRFTNEPVKLFIIGLLAAVMSAFLSSFGVQVALLSFILVTSQAMRISKTRALLGLGYAATMGGTWSIIGTTLMVMARSSYEAAVPGETIGMFEITKVSLPVGLAAIFLFCFVTSRYQPDRCGEEAAPAEDGREERQVSRRDCLIVGGLFLAFVILVTLDGHTPVPAIMAVVLVLLVLGFTHISTVSDVVNCINWDVIFFIVGITTLSDAMAASGLSDLVGRALVRLAGENASPYFVIGAICVVSGILTQLMSNSGAFGVVLPFLPGIASALGADLKPLIIAAAVACSCGFCLPLSAPSYLLLADEGRIKVSDWMKQGLPILIVCLVMISIMVPWIWPLYR